MNIVLYLSSSILHGPLCTISVPLKDCWAEYLRRPRRYIIDKKTFCRRALFQLKAAELENNKAISPEKKSLSLSDINLKDYYLNTLRDLCHFMFLARKKHKGLKSAPGTWEKLANQQNWKLPVGYKSNCIVNDNSVTARHNRAKIWKWLSGKRKGTDHTDMGTSREIYWSFLD